MAILRSFRISLVFSITLMLGVISASAQPSDYYVKMDLNATWNSLNAYGKVVPFEWKHSEIAFFEVPPLGKSDMVQVIAQEPIDIWVSEQLMLHGFSGMLYLDSLLLPARLQGKRVTIYQSGGIDESIQTRIIDTSKPAVPSVQGKKEASFASNWYLVALTTILLLSGAFRYYFPVSFDHAFTNPLADKMRSLSADEAYPEFTSFDNLFVIIFFSVLLSSLLTYLGLGSLVDSTTSAQSFFYLWFLIAGFIAGAILAKFIWSRLLAAVYQLPIVPNIQLQDRLYFFIPIIFVCLALSLLDFSFFDFSSLKLHNTVIYALILSETFFAIWFFQKLDKFLAHRKLLIITYLCTTEFLPGALALYWLEQMK